MNYQLIYQSYRKCDCIVAIKYYKKTKRKIRNLCLKVEESLHILIMNVEAFSTTKGMEFANKFLSCHRNFNGY